jgi:hypothetical protein
MRRTVRSAIGLALAATMTFTTVGAAYADPGARADDTAQATSGLLTEIAGTEAALGGLGLSLLDFADAEPKSAEFLDELARLLDDWEPGTDPAPEPPADCEVHLLDGTIVPCEDDAASADAARTTSAPGFRAGTDQRRAEMLAQWLAHAYAVAEVNSARDRNARDIGTETVYMYLAHYVDLPQDPTQYPVDYNSYANRYAAWITQDDRRVFDQYLRYDRHVEMAHQITELGTALRGLTSVPGAARAAWRNAQNWGGRLLGLGSAGWDGATDGASVIESLGIVKRAWNGADDPEAVIRMVEQGLKDQYGSAIGTEEKAGLLLAAAATIAGAPVGLVATLVTTSLIVSLAGMKDVVDQAMLAGLLATATSRVTLRYLRSIGMD